MHIILSHILLNTARGPLPASRTMYQPTRGLTVLVSGSCVAPTKPARNLRGSSTPKYSHVTWLGLGLGLGLGLEG